MSGVLNVPSHSTTGSPPILKMYEWALKRGISVEVMRSAGVMYSGRMNSVVYPRRDYDGKIVGYKIRGLDGKRQYNSPGGIPLRDTVPFVAQRGTDRRVVLCEGETDALCLATNAVELGEATIVGIPGATAFPNEWAGYFGWANDVLLIPDADQAGEKLVNRVCSLIPRTRVVRLDNDTDLTDAILYQGMGVVMDRIEAAQPVVISTKLRNASDRFVPTADIDHSSLIAFVLQDTRLVRRGKELVGICPFHDERTPSFMVDPKKNLFYCHGCGKGGDVIAYVRERFKEGYGDAIRRIKAL